jgi:hypothetical protein
LEPDTYLETSIKPLNLATPPNKPSEKNFIENLNFTKMEWFIVGGCFLLVLFACVTFCCCESRKHNNLKMHRKLQAQQNRITVVPAATSMDTVDAGNPNTI